jgi:hypothetical protein
MLTHVLVLVGHTVGHLVCNGGTSYISKVPALFKVKVNHFHCVNCLLDIYCLCALACMLCSRLISTRYQHDSLHQLERMIRV